MTTRLYLLLILVLVAPAMLAQSASLAPSQGVMIRYTGFGEGFPVLIINGGPGFNCEGFQPLAEEVASMGYRTILFDQRGTGKSELTRIDSSTITMDLMTDDIEAIRKHLGIDQWVVLGHSFGGMMGSYYTARHPERVAALILSSSGGLDLALLDDAGAALFARMTPNDIDSMTHWRNKYNETGNTADRRQYSKYLAKAYVFHQEHAPRIAERLMEGNLELNAIVWTDLRRIEYDVKDELSDFDRPVLIIQGEQDVVAKELALTAAGVFPNDQLVFLDSCGHYGWVDQKEKYFDRIETFLSAVNQ